MSETIMELRAVKRGRKIRIVTRTKTQRGNWLLPDQEGVVVSYKPHLDGSLTVRALGKSHRISGDTEVIVIFPDL